MPGINMGASPASNNDAQNQNLDFFNSRMQKEAEKEAQLAAEKKIKIELRCILSGQSIPVLRGSYDLFNFRAADRPGQLWRRFLTFSRIVLMDSCISMVKVLLLSLALTRKKVLEK